MTDQKIHVYPFERVLRPRGSMEKESLGEVIFGRLRSCWEQWTDQTYSDLPDQDHLLARLEQNLMSEVRNAWAEFIATVENERARQ